MRLKFDAFTWIVLAAMVVIVVAAVLTVNLTDSQAAGPVQYMTDNSPAAPVFNAIAAVQRGDIPRARTEFTQAALADHDKAGYDRFANAVTYYGSDAGSRRIRILKVNEGTDADAAVGVLEAAATGMPVRAPDDIAYVTIAEDNFSGGGLFGPSTYSNQRVIRVAREDGRWKVDDPNLFF